MTTRVLIIPEDFRKDQYMLKPLVKALLDYLDKPNAVVRVCTDPLLRGVGQALDKDHLGEILSRYGGMVDLFILCVDRDGEDGRRVTLSEREDWAKRTFGTKLIAENAWQELEVWVLAGHDLPGDWDWARIRQERDPKELYFDPFVREQKLEGTPGGGRKVLAEQAARRYERIRRLCPEDVVALETVIREWLEESK